MFYCSQFLGWLFGQGTPYSGPQDVDWGGLNGARRTKIGLSAGF